MKGSRGDKGPEGLPGLLNLFFLFLFFFECSESFFNVYNAVEIRIDRGFEGLEAIRMLKGSAKDFLYMIIVKIKPLSF